MNTWNWILLSDMGDVDFLIRADDILYVLATAIHCVVMEGCHES